MRGYQSALTFPETDAKRAAKYVEKRHTPGHVDCPLCAEALQMIVTPLTSAMSFAEASALFLGSRATLSSSRRIQHISPRTHRDLGKFLKTLGKFFNTLRLSDIHPGHLATYQHNRANGIGFEIARKKGGTPEPSYAAPPKINDELAVLKRVMMAACAWTQVHEINYLPLQELDSDIPKAMSDAEQTRFLTVAASIPECEVIYWYALVALHTGFSSDELRTLRQGDINLSQQLLSVNPKYGKNRYRRRTIALTDGEAIWALERLLDRSRDLGGAGGDRYLFPRRLVRGQYDGTQPISESGFRKPFEVARRAAGLEWFRLNGFRHTAITSMASVGVPIATIMKRAGHTSPKMTDHYTHISEAHERQAMQRLAPRKPVVSITTGLQQRRQSA